MAGIPHPMVLAKDQTMVKDNEKLCSRHPTTVRLLQIVAKLSAFVAAAQLLFWYTATTPSVPLNEDIGMTQSGPNQQPKMAWQRQEDIKYPLIPRLDPTPIGLQQEVITMDDLEDLKNDALVLHRPTSNETWEEAARYRQPILDLLNASRLQVDLDVLRSLPKWIDIQALYGDTPVIIGMDTCSEFRANVPAHRRFVGVAGTPNSGTTALARNLKRNIRIDENRALTRGVLNNLPWMKHSWVGLRGVNDYSFPREYQHVLPVVIVRDPYFWMRSMCESPYNLQWARVEGRCPNLVNETLGLAANDERAGIGASVRYPPRFGRKWRSMAHMWSTWYSEYHAANFPRLMVRFEDILLHPKEVVEQVRECVGAVWLSNEMNYVTYPVKDNSYFRKFKVQSSLVSALIKYGQDHGRRTFSMQDEDLDFAEHFLDDQMMKLFHYRRPDRR